MQFQVGLHFQFFGLHLVQYIHTTALHLPGDITVMTALYIQTGTVQYINLQWYCTTRELLFAGTTVLACYNRLPWLRENVHASCSGLPCASGHTRDLSGSYCAIVNLKFIAYWLFSFDRQEHSKLSQFCFDKPCTWWEFYKLGQNCVRVVIMEVHIRELPRKLWYNRRSTVSPIAEKWFFCHSVAGPVQEQNCLAREFSAVWSVRCCWAKSNCMCHSCSLIWLPTRHGKKSICNLKFFSHSRIETLSTNSWSEVWGTWSLFSLCLFSGVVDYL